MAGGVVHFEIHVDDIERAKTFYTTLFGWKFAKFEGSPDMEYWLIETDDKNQGGGLMKRNAPAAPVGSSPSSFVCTMAVESVDASMEKAVEAGAMVAMSKVPNSGHGLELLPDRHRG